MGQALGLHAPGAYHQEDRHVQRLIPEVPELPLHGTEFMAIP
jgi:hypothetical protein